MAYKTCLHSGVHFDWLVFTLSWKTSRWAATTVPPEHLNCRTFSKNVMSEMSYFNNSVGFIYCFTVTKRGCAKIVKLFFCCWSFSSWKVNSLHRTRSIDMQYLNVTMSNKLTPLFQPAVLLRVWPHDFVLKAKDLQKCLIWQCTLDRISPLDWHHTIKIIIKIMVMKVFFSSLKCNRFCQRSKTRCSDSCQNIWMWGRADSRQGRSFNQSLSAFHGTHKHTKKSLVCCS